MRRPAKTEGDGEFAGEVAMRAGGDGEEGAFALGVEKAVLFFDEGLPTASRAEGNANRPLGIEILRVNLKLRAGDSLSRGGKGQRNDPGNAAKLGGTQHGRRIEVEYLGDGRSPQASRIDSSWTNQPATTLPAAPGELLAADAIRTDHSNPCNDDARTEVRCVRLHHGNPF